MAGIVLCAVAVPLCCGVVADVAMGAAFLIVTGLGKASCPDAAVWTAGFVLGALTLAAAAWAGVIGSVAREHAAAVMESTRRRGASLLHLHKHPACLSATAQLGP
jgi:hypothetical protein